MPLLAYHHCIITFDMLPLQVKQGIINAWALGYDKIFAGDICLLFQFFEVAPEKDSSAIQMEIINKISAAIWVSWHPLPFHENTSQYNLPVQDRIRCGVTIGSSDIADSEATAFGDAPPTRRFSVHWGLNIDLSQYHSYHSCIDEENLPELEDLPPLVDNSLE